MKELLIQHEHEGQVIKRFRVKSKDGLFKIGSGRTCDIRILGDDVEIIHASLEFKNNQWLVIDLCSESGTWINEESITESDLTDSSTLMIGSHKLIVNNIELQEFNIFKESRKISVDGPNAKIYQQVAVFYRGELWESYLHPTKKKAKVRFNKKYYDVPVPDNSNWKELEIGDVQVKTRLVKSSMFEAEEESIWKLFPQDLVRPMATAFGSVFIFLLAMFLIPMALTSAPEKLDENQYTKLMFDKKTIEKQKKKAKKLAKKIAKPKKTKVTKKPKKVAKKKASASPKMNVQKSKSKTLAASRSNRKVNKKVSKVANSIKAAGLSSLVNKVSARAASNAKLIRSKGVKAGTKNSGRGFASLNDLKKGGQLSSAAKTGSFRVGGVNTNGTAGGSNVSGSLGSLSGGSVGGASVSGLESETEIEGGLTAAQIKSVVQKHIGAIRYCYERQLTANPNLYGKIKVEFVISPQGRVVTQNVKSTTMKNKMVEGCILRKIKRWNFPLPKGGSEVAVSYPFYFKSTR